MSVHLPCGARSETVAVGAVSHAPGDASPGRESPVRWTESDERELSCGVVIVNDAAELLLCHVTGQAHWDLPKGGAHAGETPLEAALRETREETGLVLDAAALVDLGRFVYSLRKDLHLFATRTPRFDPAALHCDSLFTCRASGRRLPEMDGYGWFAFDAVVVRCRPRLASVLVSRLDLPALLARLQDAQAAVAA
ncbi:MAG: NUDIX domain-containing protein [Rubrivivax sp.]|nr:NUDIX domain-containing protein [Rubrivivax sp.]